MDPLPPLDPIAGYQARVTVAEDSEGNDLPARAILSRHPSGQVVFSLRGYYAEPDGVRGWDQRVQVVLAVAGVPNGESPGGVILEPNAPELSSVWLNTEHHDESGFGNPVISIALEAEQTFSGEVQVDVASPESSEVRRVSLAVHGSLEAVECDSPDVTELWLTSTVAFPCTEALGEALGQPPAADAPGADR